VPAAAASAAPRGQTGIASGLTNKTKTVGGSFASSAFAILLAIGAVQIAGQTAGSLFGYIMVWAICGAAGVIAAVLLLVVPKNAFADAPLSDDEAAAALKAGL